MTKEYKLQFKVFLKLLWVCGFALLYALGGIEHKWLRRFIAPLWLGIGQFIITKGDWRVLLQMPLLMFSLSLGYGADLFLVKIGRRLVFGFANGFTNITHLFDQNFNKKRFWTLFCLAITITPVICIILGTINPVVARSEELLIGFFIGIWGMFIVKEKSKDVID
jgi:hypothetical protein